MYKILVVEDDEKILKLIKDRLYTVGRIEI